MLFMKVGKRLADLRNALHWTQYRLAKEAGMAPTHIKQIEDGLIDAPSIRTMERLRVALGVKPGEFYAPGGSAVFLTVDEPPTPPPKTKPSGHASFRSGVAVKGQG